MKVTGIAWLGSPTDRFDEMMRFATDVLGPRAIADEHIGPVHRADGGGWSHFFGPDGHVYEITGRA